MFQTKIVEKTKTHILGSIMFSRKSCRLWDNVGKYAFLYARHQRLQTHIHSI